MLLKPGQQQMTTRVSPSQRTTETAHKELGGTSEMPKDLAFRHELGAVHGWHLLKEPENRNGFNMTTEDLTFFLLCRFTKQSTTSPLETAGHYKTNTALVIGRFFSSLSPSRWDPSALPAERPYNHWNLGLLDQPHSPWQRKVGSL